MRKIISGILAFTIFMGVISNPVSAYVQEEQNKINIENSINKDSDLITNDKYGIVDINLYNLLADESGKVSKSKLINLKELTITNESNVSTLKGLDVCTNLEKLIIESKSLNSLDGIESLENLKELVVNQGEESNILSFSNISKAKSIKKVTLVDIDSKRFDVLFGNENIEEINITLKNYNIEESLNISKKLKESNNNLTKLSINNLDFMNQNLDLDNEILLNESQQNNYDNLDINGDGVIDVLDLSLVASRYNTTKESEKWDIKYDVNNDGIVDLFDLVLVSKAMGDTTSTEDQANLKSFTTSLLSGQAINQTITLSATSDLDKDVLYEFSVIGDYDNTWTTLKSYSNTNNAKWIPTKTGNYTLRVKVKHINSKEEYDDLSEIRFEVVGDIKSSKLYVSNYGRIDLNKKEVPLIAITYEDDNVVYKVPDELKQENNVIAINSDKSITTMKTGKGRLIAKYKGQQYYQDITVTDNKALLDKYNNMTNEPLKDSVIDVEVKAQSITEGIKLSWVYLPIITKYEIYRKDSVSNFVKIAELEGSLAPEEYVDKEVEANKEYVYRIDVTTTDNITQQLNEIKITADNMANRSPIYLQTSSEELSNIDSSKFVQIGTKETKQFIKNAQKAPFNNSEAVRRIVPQMFDYKNIFIYTTKNNPFTFVLSTDDDLLPILTPDNYLMFSKSKDNLKFNCTEAFLETDKNSNLFIRKIYYNIQSSIGTDKNGDYVYTEYKGNELNQIGANPETSCYVYKYTTPDGEVIYPDDLTLEEDDDGEIITKSSLNISAKAGTSLTKGLVGLDPEDCQFKEGNETVVFATNGSPHLARVYKIQERDAMGKVKLYAIPYELSKFYVDNKGPGDAKALLSLLLDFTPIFSDVKDLYELLDGKDMITGEELNRTIMLVVLLTPAILDKPLKILAKKGAKNGPELAEELKKLGKNSDDVVADEIAEKLGKLAYKADYAEHLKKVMSFNRDATKGITGGHNMDEFMAYFRDVEGLVDKDFIETITPHKSFDGIYQIKYKIPKKDNQGNILAGQYKIFKNPKTVYDPSILSDDEILKWGEEAMKDGIMNNTIQGDKIIGVASNGLKFEGWINREITDNIEVSNFYPKAE